MSNPQRDIKSFDEAGLLGAIGDLGEPAYRVRQLLRWLYGRRARSFGEMTDLSKGLRARLTDSFDLGVPELVERQTSRDGTRKYLWSLSDGVMVESVGLPARARLTVCYSTQAGCAMGCSFCATGRAGFARDLTPGEMVDQVSFIAADFGARATNAVAMGQGEPFANYDATLGALRILNSPDALGIGARHLTVSTCGIVAGIQRFTEEPEQFTMAVSLHSAVQKTRDRLMPGVRGDRLSALHAALAEYSAATGRRPTLEYALLDGVNDTPDELQALTGFCRDLLCHVNLIPASAVAGADLERSSDEVVRRFGHVLREAGIEVSVRVERGADIDAACGQLRQRVAEGPATGQSPR